MFLNNAPPPVGEEMLTIDLLPQQQRDPKYRLRYNQHGRIVLSNKQRSWIDSMLRNKMGGKNVALFVFTHGSTRLFDATLRSLRSKERTDEELLQSTLDDAFEWFETLIGSMLLHDSQPQLAERHVLGAKTRCPAQEKRRQLLREATSEKRHGRALVRQRDAGKFKDMSVTEQQRLEAFETGAVEKKRQRYLVPAQQPFR